MLYVYGWVMLYIIGLIVWILSMWRDIGRIKNPRNASDFELYLIHLVIDLYMYYLVADSFYNFIFQTQGVL